MSRTNVSTMMLGLLVLLLHAHLTTAALIESLDSSRPHHSNSTLRCKLTGNTAWYFHRYLPSEWERDWIANREQWDKDGVCKTMQKHASNSKQWVDNLAALIDRNGELDMWGLEHLKTNVWSALEYINPCVAEDDPNRVVRVPIEPVVGLMRHPYSPPPCVPSGANGVSTESRDYVLVNAVSPRVFKQLYPGRAWFFDLGARTYESSISWFVDRYAAQGIQFDGIFGWEAAGIDHPSYWQQVPARIVPRLHLYNMPVQTDLMAPGQPLNVLYEIYRPGDFVAFKLDIDAPAIEDAVVDGLSTYGLQHMIGEMYYEHHSTAADMKENGWELGTSTSWSDSIAMFHRLRQEGLRIHFWP